MAGSCLTWAYTYIDTFQGVSSQVFSLSGIGWVIPFPRLLEGRLLSLQFLLEAEGNCRSLGYPGFPVKLGGAN
jgi:hypothetical protein